LSFYFGNISEKGVNLGMAKSYSKGEPKISIVMDDSNMPYLISNVRKGIGYSDFEAMVAFSSFTLPEWSTILHLTSRSLQRYKQQKQTFDPLQSEKIIQIIILFKKGISVFGSKEKFNTWLDSDIVALGGIKPKEVLDSAFGIEWIMDELGRIEHGILA
jgi:putative toxin-antitoxin system antitoxin component (TIGR02293 family)